MPPGVHCSRPHPRASRRGRRAVSLAAFVAFAATPAAAIVGGGPDPGPAGRSAVMVLNSRGGVCSGVVVSPDAVLTAAHCARRGDALRVHFRRPDGSPALLEPVGVSVHPGFDARAVEGRRPSVDLALLRIGEVLPFDPAALSTSRPPNGTVVLAGGFGIAKETEPGSDGTFRTVRLDVAEPHGPGRILLWLRPRGEAAGACRGDSGGPVMVGGAVVAVLSWATGRGAARCGEWSQAVLVAPQRGWIDTVLAGWSGRARWRDGGGDLSE